MMRIGIECEQLEGERFGVGHTLAALLEALTRVPHVRDTHRFFLYFKRHIPGDAFLADALFEKRICTGRWLPPSFNLFYHVLLPWRHFRDSLDCFFFPSYMLPAFFIGRAVVVLTNDVWWEAHHGNLPLKYRLSYRLFCWWAAKRAKRIVTLSHVSRAELMRLYRLAPERIIVNPWGIDQGFFVRQRNDRYEAQVRLLKEKFGIGADFIFSLGQAFPRRHIKEAIEAFGRIAPRYPQLQYLVACADKYEPRILETAIARINETLGRRAVLYHAYLPQGDVPYLMNEMRALVYISEKEAQGLPPIEAVRCGRPAVVMDTALSRETLGHAGFFVRSPSDREEIGNVLMSLLDEPERTAAIVQKQAEYAKRFDWPMRAQTLLGVFREACDL